MEKFLDILSLRGLFGNKDLEEEVAEYVVGVPESKARRQWDKGYVSSTRNQVERSIEENQIAEMKELNLDEKASYDDVRRKRQDNYYEFQSEYNLEVLKYALLNIKPEYSEERCFRGKNICVLADSLKLARVIAYLDNEDLFYKLPHTRDVTIPEYIVNIQMREQGDTLFTYSPIPIEPLFQGTPTIPTEKDKENCLTYSKVYDKLQKLIDEDLELEEVQ